MQRKTCRSLKLLSFEFFGRGCTGKDYEVVVKVGYCPAFFFFSFKRVFMKKTDADQLLKRAEPQFVNTSAGGHLGGTNHGQAYDAKTASHGKTSSGKGRKNGKS